MHVLKTSLGKFGPCRYHCPPPVHKSEAEMRALSLVHVQLDFVSYSVWHFYLFGNFSLFFKSLQNISIFRRLKSFKIFRNVGKGRFMSNGGPDRFRQQWWCTFARKPMSVWKLLYLPIYISHKYGSIYFVKLFSFARKFSLIGHIWNLDTMQWSLNCCKCKLPGDPLPT